MFARRLTGAQCAETIEKRFKGQRYVYSRARCKNRPVKGSSYCGVHGGKTYNAGK